MSDLQTGAPAGARRIFSRRFMPALCALLLWPAPGAAYVALDRIIAIVNEDVVMQSELEQRLRSVRGQLREEGARLPPGPVLERQVLDSLIQGRIQLQLAARAGIRVDDETLNRAINNIAAENKVSLGEFRRILEADGYNYPRFREDIRNQITLSQLRQRQVENRISVTEREIDDFLANREFQGDAEAEIRLSHILLALPADAPAAAIEQARQGATELRRKLLAGADFAETARRVSDGGNAGQGGDLGWRKMAEVPTLFAEYIPDLGKGDISEPIRSPSGFHLIRIADIKGAERSIVAQTRARHILIRTGELMTEAQAREKLAQLKARIEGGDDFGLLARGNSDDAASAIAGGDLGWRSPGELAPEFQRAMDALAIGQISAPFQTGFGWHIVEALERRQHDNTESLKRGRARGAIRARKLEEATQNWARELRDEAYVEYRLNAP